MSVKTNIMDFLRHGYRFCRDIVYFCATRISPELNTRMRYRSVFHCRLNLKNPRTMNEKVLWLKLNRYRNDPTVIQCADKYLVRDYVRQCGCADILNELIGVYNQASEIPWDDLPRQFALKWNFGAGMNVICRDKDSMTREEVIRKMDRWGRDHTCWLSYSEMQYKYINRKIICEKYLQPDDRHGVIPDYKVYCFHGEPKAILVMYDRDSGMKVEFFDSDWKMLETPQRYRAAGVHTEKPACFDRMMDAARKLSKPFPFLRCDFYVVNGTLYFGEMTFTPAAGLYFAQTRIDGKDMTEFLNLPLPGKKRKKRAERCE